MRNINDGDMNDDWSSRIVVLLKYIADGGDVIKKMTQGKAFN